MNGNNRAHRCSAGHSGVGALTVTMATVHSDAPKEPVSDRSWLSRLILPGGSEPDPRFTLANERTFLAWTRTSLAFLAGGVALGAFDIPGLGATMRTALAVFVMAVGLVIAVGAAVRWVRVERAMRAHRPLPVPAIIPVLSAAGVLACGIAIGVML